MTALRYSATSAGESIVPRRHLRKFLIAEWVVLVTLGGLEVAVRMWRYSQRHVYDPIYMSYEGGEDIPYIQKPNLVEVRTRTCSHQHR